MTDLSASALRRHTRANWLALRTLRQVPRMIGRTHAGAPIFEIRSVRLVLHDEALYFTRLVRCSRCGEEVNGTSVLTPADLDHGASAVMCNDCAGTAAPAAFPNSSSRVRDADVYQLETAVEGQAGSLGSERSPLGFASSGLARSQDEMARRLGLIGERLADETERNNRRLDAFEARLLEMQEGIARVVERIARDVERTEARIEEVCAMRHEPDLPRIEEQLNDRLDRLAERAARPDNGEGRRLLALEATVADLARPITELEDAEGAELATSRLEALEGNAAQMGQEIAQLGDLQGVLDVGLGQLRSRIDELTDVTKTLALGQATLAAMKPRMTEDRRRTLGRSVKPAQAPVELTADRASNNGESHLEDKQVKAQLAMLDHMSDVALTASSGTPGNLYDLRALAEQLAGHDEALTRLSRSVERLRRNSPTQRVAPRATSHRSSS
jgi:hypothetical protein